MALINCPECEKQVSDQAKNCPDCGYPIKEETIVHVEENNKTQDSKQKRSSSKGGGGIGFTFLILFFLVATLPLHYVMDYVKNSPEIRVFPKESLSFKNTLVTPEVIGEEIDRYNNASFPQRNIIENEYFHRKLIKLGFIWKKSEEE